MATMDAVWIDGPKGRYPICPQCGSRANYSMDWDSIWCEQCNWWLQQACRCTPDSGCPYVGRPENPTGF